MSDYLQYYRDIINDSLKDSEPLKLIFGSVIAIVGSQGLIKAFQNRKQIEKLIVKNVFKVVQNTPGAADKIAKAKEEIVKSLVKDFDMSDPEGISSLIQIPFNGLSHEEVYRQMKILQERDSDHFRKSAVTGCVYWGNQEHDALLNKCSALFSLSNPLHPDVFPSIRKFEHEVARMTIAMLNGGPQVCGCVTSGGTESILTAVKVYRDKGFAEKGITDPEMILPITAHAAFSKAAEYFKIQAVYIDVDENFKVDLKKVRKAITKNTVVIVGSAPEYAHGIIDPIEELGAIALEHGVGFHVDACLGGYALPWAKKLGFLIPAFDWSVPGVTSMSCDTHKYGYATKGSSVVMYVNKELRAYQYFCLSHWPGGSYASPGIAGSRPGVLIAACWASLAALGESGFKEITQGLIDTTRQMLAGIRSTPGLKVVGEPLGPVFAFYVDGSDRDTYRLASCLADRHGFHLGKVQLPAAIHFSVTAAHIGLAKKFVDALQVSMDLLRADQNIYGGGSAALYGLTTSLPESVGDALVSDLAANYMDAILDYPTHNQHKKL